MEFVQWIYTAFASLELQPNVLDERGIEDHIKSLQKNLIDTVQNFAAAPIVIERTKAWIKELEETDVTDLSEAEKVDINGGIKQHKIQLIQLEAQQQRALEDIAYFQALIINRQKILTKFSQ